MTPAAADRPPDDGKTLEDVARQLEAMARQIEALGNLYCTLLNHIAHTDEAVARLTTFVGLAPPAIDPTERITINKAAGRLACSGSRVRQLIKAGRLSAEKTYGRVMVSVDSITKLLASRSPPDRA